jgi:hypothetical protein
MVYRSFDLFGMKTKGVCGNFPFEEIASVSTSYTTGDVVIHGKPWPEQGGFVHD